METYSSLAVTITLYVVSTVPLTRGVTELSVTERVSVRGCKSTIAG